MFDPADHRRLLTMAVLSLAAVVGQAASASAQATATTRVATRTTSGGRAPSVALAEPSLAFAQLDPTVSTRRLIASGSQLDLGVPGDDFADLLAVSATQLAVAGRRTAGDQTLLLVLADFSENTAAEPQQTEFEVPRSTAGNRQIGPRLVRSANLLSGGGPPVRTAVRTAVRTSVPDLTMAWLEQTDVRRNEVWAADFQAGTFGAPYRLADAGPGGQVALSGVTLSDGTQLFVWSRFDGNDSEITWVKRNLAEQPEWTAPIRLNPDNDVPDVNPTLVAVGEQALVAWSSYDYSLDDGTYRVFLARFDGESWTAPEAVSGAGGLYPRFIAGAAQPTMSYLDAKNRRWAFSRFDHQGIELAVASVEKTSAARPLVLGETDVGLTLTRQATPATGVASATEATTSMRTAAPLQTTTATRQLRWEDPR